PATVNVKPFRPLPLALAAALACVSFAALAQSGTMPGGEASVSTRAAGLPRDSVYQLPMRMSDQHGRTLQWQSRRGKPQLVSMFYASCRYICPLIIEGGKAVERALTPAQRERLGVMLISMDPERDTPQALAALAEARRVDPRWVLAAPPPPDVRALAGVLGRPYAP